MRKLIACAFTALAIVPLPAFAGSWQDIHQLSELVEVTGTEIVRTKCYDHIYGSYEYNDDAKIDRLTICTNRVDMEDHDSVWEVLAHEATHVAQTCIGGNVFEATRSTRIFRNLRIEAPHYAELLDGYSDVDKMSEAEAFYMELQSPKDVKEMVIKACDITSVN